MNAQNIPVYAIVEVLIRVSNFDEGIGNYLNHVVQPEWVVIRTSKGVITFSNDLIAKQLEQPEKITNEELLDALANFEPR